MPRVLGDEHPTTLSLKSDVARFYRETGRYDEAEQLYTEVRIPVNAIT
jgi:hypothetical protein